MITERVVGLASADVYMTNSYKDGHHQAFAAADDQRLWGTGLGLEAPWSSHPPG